MTTRFLSVAARELAEANDYYESISPDLALRFIFEVDAALSRIKANPLAWSPMGARHRRCRLSTFPFGLVYALPGDEVLVVAVAHLHRDPRHWRDRIEP